FSSRRRHTRSKRDWSSDVRSSDLYGEENEEKRLEREPGSEPARKHGARLSVVVAVALGLGLRLGLALRGGRRRRWARRDRRRERSEERRVGKEWRAGGWTRG